MDEQNKYTVIVSEHAKQMLVSHAAFLAQTSVNAAHRLADSFEKTAGSLEFMPQRCAAALILFYNYEFLSIFTSAYS